MLLIVLFNTDFELISGQQRLKSITAKYLDVTCQAWETPV